MHNYILFAWTSYFHHSLVYLFIYLLPQQSTKIYIKVCSKTLDSISRFTYDFFIFHPICIIFWQSKGVAEHFMLSEKYFGKNEIRCEKNEKENLQLLYY